jgi:hypothetical protein
LEFPKIEPKPLSVYDENTMLNEVGTAFIVGVSPNLLMKWRRRGQNPDYLQYGKNGPLHYELKALLEFRDTHRVVIYSRL